MTEISLAENIHAAMHPADQFVAYILLDWPTWYIIAWDHLRMSSRMFRIDRIKNTRAVDSAFRLRPQHLFIDKFAPYFKAI